MFRADTEPSVVPAAVYVRMSTEHQQYSTSNQMDVIQEYAKRRGMRIVKEYSDEGKSGLSIQGRDSLAQMIQDVQTEAAGFSAILVYDVSRWGRFQDADESAYYEYICRRAGMTVHYCAEQFKNDGSPVSTIVKGVKRAMAGEYSRELSSKVFQGACRLIQLGFKQGGTAGYGLRRMLVDQNGQEKAILKMGEHKSLQTDRVVLVAGPEEEVEVVRWIYSAFLNDGKTESEIAASLNAQGIVTDFGRPWTRGTVHQVLTNEKYIGNNVYHRTSFKLKRKHVVNPPDRWIRADGVFEGIVDPELFFKAREIIISKSQTLTDDEMLDKLRELLAQRGRLSGIIIDEAEELSSSAAFSHRFGSLVSAYRLIGYDPRIDYSFIEINRNRRPPTDPVNAMLSLAYSMLTKDCTLAALAVGFDPYIGFYHQPRFGRPALGLDLMEEFRPLIAEFTVLSCINNRVVTDKDFVRAGQAVNLTAPGRKRFFQTYEQRMSSLITHPLFDYKVSYRLALELQARLLAKTLTGEIAEYIPLMTR